MEVTAHGPRPPLPHRSLPARVAPRARSRRRSPSPPRRPTGRPCRDRTDPGLSDTEIERRIIEAIRARLGREATPGDGLRDLGIDSIDMASFIGEIEDEFRIRVDAEIDDVETVADLAAYVAARRQR